MENFGIVFVLMILSYALGVISMYAQTKYKCLNCTTHNRSTQSNDLLSNQPISSATTSYVQEPV